MVRQESDREDLFAEAVALVRRAELNCPGFAEAIVIGERREGAWSIYIGGDPVYHLDAVGGLRRAFVDGKLLRTQGTFLAELTRERSTSKTWLNRRDLSAESAHRLLNAMRDALQRLSRAIEAGECQVERTTGDDRLLSDFCRFVTTIDGRQADPFAPAIPGKK